MRRKLGKRFLVYYYAKSKEILIMGNLFLFLAFINVQIQASSLDLKLVSMSLQNGSLYEMLKSIEEQTGFGFLYSESEIDITEKVSVNAQNMPLDVLLGEVLPKLGVDFEIDELVIVLKPQMEKKEALGDQRYDKKIAVKGRIIDKEGLPLPGATIIDLKSRRGVITDSDGNYTILVADSSSVLRISFVGFKTIELTVGSQTIIDVQLQYSDDEIDEVVVTGIVQISKSSFTGTATIVKAEELISMGSDNVIKSLTLLDPSLNILDNNVFGSNPNVLPEISLRGDAILSVPNTSIDRTSLSADPNQPVFIMDDFETTLTKVIDMDMNRIESVTILKDAAATAMYGSRAANGVIVITTKQPEAGKLQVSYNLNTDFSFPDLGSYDILNAEELFGLQKDLGLYDYLMEAENTGVHKVTAIEKYVAQGVNTDWLAQPVRNAVGQKHSLNLMGGDKYMRYMLDVNYSDKPGVMKESGRKNSGIALTLNYNINDQLIFRNRLSVDKNNAENSPYGSFDYYAKMPSFLPINYANGQPIERYAIPIYDTGSTTYFPQYNPVYEAGVGNSDESEYTNINNNFSLEWRMTSALKLKANLSYTFQNSKSHQFNSPESYLYWSVSDPEKRGSYAFDDVSTESYYGNAIFNYMKEMNGHFINASLGYNISSSSSELLGFKAVGFAASNFDNPAFASSYATGEVPDASEQTVRLIGGLASVNYSYDRRFLADFTYRLDGSSQFGSNDKTAGFYSAGLGWNIHHENFLKGNSFISLFKIKGTYGETGSVNFSAYQAKDVLQYYKSTRYLGGLGTYLAALGNENLTWQTTSTLDLGADFGFFSNIISGSFNYYNKNTSDMIMDVTTPPSIGFNSFKENLGEMENKGFEFALRAKLMNRDKIKWNVYLSGYQNKSKILGIGNALKSYNELSDQAGLTDAELQEYEENNGSSTSYINETSHDFYVRFEEGESNTAIYAVRSLGIDPMTGKEIFLTKDGEPTFTWNAEDKVIVGDTEATLRGNFGTNVAYGPLEMSFTFSYSMGAQQYNYTLVDKVENSNKYYNVDRRVLEETWMEPGDVVRFKSNVLNWGNMSYTPASDRFVQDYSYINLSSMNINYYLPERFYTKLGMESMRLSFNMSDVFNWSTVKMERGTSYPYARSFSMGLRANF
ncbi:SusC/RagA family TonB-linked outer membrane protein [Saccharicrinis fermentans]|uniref:Outer membrane cobalamin receptor protein n=1 Tax=Saccharicrinis fermentans DSM 9555 = JCM 21142 TaxID=869213 RepID=W7Y303_9BACT|nr:SusC/RagA family TonB-linked outer membrane protein [Saccharicrinis fermentans]GAF05210.1 outer membrane cobalamin receptor protein [Saccharicrinis fermentans DSM 9555 = JCM 21142]